MAMEPIDKELLAKARRRINRFIKNGQEKHVARVTATDDPNIFKYRSKNYGTLWFRRDVLGRLKRVDPTKIKMVA